MVKSPASAPPAITVSDVSKRFRLHRNSASSLKEALLNRGPKEADEFWALRNVNLTVEKGSFFGLMGHNGSGKSTLLRMMAGIYPPTSGAVTSNGSISALLELGSGFHPDLTGRENIFLNGAMLGQTQRQVEQELDSIIDFSGIGDFIDSPVKAYSSGMVVRLGFAVAVHVEPEILLVDEVIAVGDEDFQRRCLDHIHLLRNNGTTVVLVSHSTSLMGSLCDRIAWLDHGELQLVGDPSEVIGAYLSRVTDAEIERLSDAGSSAQVMEGRRGDGRIRVRSVSLVGDDGGPADSASSGDPIRIRITFDAVTTIDNPGFGLSVHHQDSGALVSAPSTHGAGSVTGVVNSGPGFIDLELNRVVLMPGKYHLSVWVHESNNPHLLDEWGEAASLIVKPGSSAESEGIAELGVNWGVVRPLAQS